jgi:glycogen debranching enzyme
MNITKQLSGISTRLNELIEDLDRVLDYTDNNELYNEIDNNVKSQLENAQTHLDIAIDDISDGMYENPPADEEDLEEWD